MCVGHHVKIGGRSLRDGYFQFLARVVGVAQVVPRGDMTPPEEAILMTSAPARITSRTLRRTSSGPSAAAPRTLVTKALWSYFVSTGGLEPPRDFSH